MNQTKEIEEKPFCGGILTEDEYAALIAAVKKRQSYYAGRRHETAPAEMNRRHMEGQLNYCAEYIKTFKYLSCLNVRYFFECDDAFNEACIAIQAYMNSTKPHTKKGMAARTLQEKFAEYDV